MDVLDRIGAVKPFLMSAAKSGSPDVLGALDETLSTLEASLRGMRAAGVSRLTSTRCCCPRFAPRGRRPTSSFAGDRTAQAREAFVLYDAALNAGSLITPAAQ